MAIQPFHWDDLGRFKRDPRFIAHYPPDVRSFFSPDDDIHGLLMSLLASSQQSIVLNMYGYADHELDDIIRAKLLDERVYVQMSLDKSQSLSSKTEREILSEWDNGGIGNSIAIGTSYKHAISHLKIVIVDGIYTVKGSTNWSMGGQRDQDNELTLTNSAVIAAEARAVLDRNHDWMLKQMAKKAARARFKSESKAGGKAA